MTIFEKLFGSKDSHSVKSKGKTCPTCGEINPFKVKFCSSCGNEFHVVLDKFDAFISYRRDTGSELASLLKIQLENRYHKTIFLDVNELQVGRFDEELLKRIENTPNFIVILSKGSLDRCANKSDWLKREIMHAIKTERNIIPVMTEGFTFPSEELWTLLPAEMRWLSSLNGINYSHIHQDSAIRKIASYCKNQTDTPIGGIIQEVPKKVEISTNIIVEASLPSTESPDSQTRETERKDPENALSDPKYLPGHATFKEINKNNESNLESQNVTSEFFHEGWGIGTTINLKLLGTSSKDHRIYKNPASSSSMNLKISDSVAYLPTSEGIRAYNISQPVSPKLLSLFSAGYSSRKWFELINNYGFIRGSDASINVIDYKDPSNPKAVYFDNHYRNIFNNCGNGLLTYNKTIMIDLCHTESCGVKVLDFSDTDEISKNVRIIGVIKYYTGCGAIYKHYLLLGNSSQPQIRIVSIDKESAEEIKTLPLDSKNGGIAPQGIATDGLRLYAFGTNTLRRYQPILCIFNLKNFPEEIECENSFELPKDQCIKALFGLQVNVSDNWLYYNDGTRLCIYDISDPTQPELAFTKDGTFSAASIIKNLVYCGDDKNIWVFNILRNKNK